MKIREATYDDIHDAVALGAQHHAESHQSWLPFAPEKLAAYARQFIDSPDCLAVVAVNAQDRVVGYMGAYVAPYFFCDELQAADLLVFVSRQYRGSSAAYRLIRAYMKWAEAKGVREATLGLRANINIERTGRFYEKMGFRQSIPHYAMRF